MNYSPKLRQAMEEIKAVLNKYDIAGLVVLHTPGHGEHLLKLNPSYSAIEMKQFMTAEGLQQGIKFKVNTETHPDHEKRIQTINDSLNMVSILCSLSAMKAENLIDISDSIENSLKTNGIDITHTPGKNTNSREIDN